MTDRRPLSMAIWRYDRTQALYDGRICVPGYDLALTDAPLEEIFTRAFVDAEFDVSELSFSNFLRLTAAGTCPYVGIPIFPSRAFRHSAFYVRADAGIATPADLRGRRVGVREFSMTAALAARGALRDPVRHRAGHDRLDRRRRRRARARNDRAAGAASADVGARRPGWRTARPNAARRRTRRDPRL